MSINVINISLKRIFNIVKLSKTLFINFLNGFLGLKQLISDIFLFKNQILNNRLDRICNIISILMEVNLMLLEALFQISLNLIKMSLETINSQLKLIYT